MAIRKNTVLVNDGGSTGNKLTATVANAAKAATTAATKASPATKLSTTTVSVTPPKTNTVTSPTTQQTAPNRVTTAVPNVAVQTPQQRAQNIVQNQKQTLGAANRNKIQEDYQKRLSTWSEQNEQEWKQARQEARNAISQEKGRTYHVGIDLNPQQERSDKVNQAVRNYQEINARRDTSSPNATTQISSDDPTKNPISYFADYVTGGVESGVSGVGRFLEDTKYSIDRTKKEDNLYRQGWSREAVNNFLKQDDTKRQQNRGANALEADAQQRMGAYQVKEGSTAEVLGNAAQGVGNTIPSMLANLVVPGSGMATLFMSAAGNSAKEALDSGADFNKAYAYGVLSGITEVATEKMFGGLPALGQGYESIEKAIEAAINRSAGNEVERAILRYITDAAGEATEEYLSEVVGAYTRMLWDTEAREKGIFAALDPEVQKQAGQAALSGAISGGFMNIISFTPSGRYSADVEAFADALVDSGVLDESAVRNRNGNIKNEIYNLYDAGIGNTNINRALGALEEGAGPEIMQDLFTGIKQTAETRKAHLEEVEVNNKAVVETLPQATRANVEAALDVADDLGVTVVLDPSLGNDNGFMDPTTGDITLNPNTPNPVFAVLVHELGHRNEGTKAYNDFLKAVLSDFDNRLKASGSRFTSVDQYANFLLANNYRESEIPGELASNYAQEYLFTDPQAIKQFVEASRSKASRIWRALKQAITKVKDPALINAEYLYSQALGEATVAADAGYWDTLALERNPVYSRGRSELRRVNDGNTSSVSENGLGDGGVLQEASEADLEGGRLTTDEGLRREMRQSGAVLEGNLRRVNDVLKNANNLAKKAGAPDVQLRTTDASTFANALAAQMTDDNPYKNHLSWHSAEKFADAGAQMFLTKDGKTGVAVWPNGDITSVFNSNKSKGGSSTNLMLTAIAMGGNQLDCTGDALLQRYALYGFIPTGKIAFVDKEAAPDWDYARFGRPDIYFFVHNGQSVEEVARNIGKYPEIRGEDVPYFPDWDAADDYRQAVKNGEQPMPKYSKGGTGLFDDYMSQFDYYSPDYNKGLEDWLSEDVGDDEDILEAPDFAEYDNAQLNNAYEEALEADDEWTMEDIVAEAANRAMPNSVVRDAAGRLMPVYHGTDMFGWTEIDLNALDDGRSIFLVDNPTTASTYSGATDETRAISDRVDIPNFKKMSDKQMQEFIDEQLDGIYYAPEQADKAEAIEQELMLVNLDAQNALDVLYDLADGIPDSAFKACSEALEPLLDEDINAQTLEKQVSQVKKVMLRYPQYMEMIREGARQVTGSDPFKTFEDTVRNVENIRDAQFTDGNSFWTKDNMAQFLRTEYEWGQKGNYKVYVNLVNPLIIDGEGRWWNDLMDTLPEAIDYSGWDIEAKKYTKNGYLTTRGISAYAQDNGYDGVIFKDIVDEGGYSQFKSKGPSTVYIAFDPNAVKSADAVTYDDDGKVIPLSERFNTERNELRYSRGGTGLRENVSKVASNTYTRTDYIDDINKALMGLDDEDSPYTYNVKGEAQSLANAQARIDADLEGEMQTLPNQEVFDGEDTDTAMMIMHEMFEQGNVDEALRWAKIIQEKGTEAGQRIQAFAKYTRTPEGFIVKGERAIDNALNEWAAKHPREVELIKQLADHLTEWYPSFTADITTEEGFQAVADYIRALAKEYKVNIEQTEAEWIASLLNQKRRANEIEKAFERLQADLGTDLTGEEVDEIFQYIEEAKQYPSTSKEAAELHAKAAAVIAKHLNSSFTDKWNAWRYLAMLGNTRTHIRNMLGNLLFGAVVDIKNALAGQLEAATGLFTDIDRTKTANIAYLLTPEGQALYKAAKQDGNDIYTVLSGESKYNINREIEGQKQIFDFAPLEALRKFNGDMLEKEDWWTLKADYAKYLSNYMYANGLSPEILQNPNNAQARKARVYAVQEAQKATFRNVNEFARRYTEFSNGLNNSNNLAVRAIGTMAEGLLPFKNTPANILARGAEYSPLGLLDAIGKGVEMVARGTVSADEFIDSLSSGLTGTGIMVLGYMLASMGLVTGGDDDDEKLQKLKDAEGWQPYSLHVGDKYYTLDWVAPAAIPLFVGANLQALGEMQGADFNDFLTSLSTMAEPLTEMTMMQGVNNILESISYGENKLVDTAFTMGTNYVTQAVPTALGQVARAVDETRRTSTTDNDGFLGDLEYTWRKARSKVPFLSRENEPYLDVWGREQENAGGSVAGRLAYNMLSPGYYSQENVAGVDMLIEDLYAATGEAKYLPSSPSRSLNINGEKTRLSAEDYTTYAKAKGRTARGLIEDYIAQGGDIEWETVGEAVELAYKISNAYGKAMVGADLTEEEASYLDLIGAGADPVEILNMGKLSKKQRELFIEGLERGYTLEQMQAAYDAGFGGTKVVVTDSLDPEMYYALMDAGASPEAIAAVDVNGNATWTQQEIFESALTEEEKRLIWEMMGYKTSYDTYARKH